METSTITMETINFIVIHCSATREDHPFGLAQLEASHRERGFNGIGYHFYITRDGDMHRCRPLFEPGAHAKGFNYHSLAICYEGGLDREGNPKDTRTLRQCVTMLELVGILKKMFPQAKVVGHYQLSTDIHKACPCFDARKEYENT
ncbi:MAG: N-acetylmuramoyl-L-alanine amidase [Bacteroidaceae bacterium]